MSGPSSPVSSSAAERPSDDRLDSWKEIAAYLRRDVTTVQRWEKREGMPVHRHVHDKMGSVYAFKTDLDAWARRRSLALVAEPDGESVTNTSTQPVPAAGTRRRNRLGSLFAHTAELDAWRDARDPAHHDTSNSARRRGAIRRRVWVLAAAFAGVITAAIGLGRVADRGAAVGDPPIGSLAVLPLEDFSPEPRQPYLPDGMTEALIGELSVLHGLQVISRTSVMQFKGTRTPAPEVARLLNVDAVIEGSVQRSGNRLRISAQLVRAASGRTLWSGAYDRELGDVLSLQSEVARIIAREVGATVTPGEHARLTKRRTVVPEAYESYLKGLFHLNQGSESVEAAVSEFEKATASDPSFAPAYAHLAAAYQALGGTSVGVLPVAEARPKAIAAANRALAIDPHVARAHAVLAFAHQQEWRWQEAEAAYRRAIEIDPSDVVAHAGYARLLVWRGRTEEGLAYQRRARELDVLSAQRTVALGWLLYHARRYDDAIRELQTVLAVEPDDRAALWFLSFALIDSSRVDDAIQVLERLVVLRNRNPAELGLLARAYGRAGRRSDAQRIVDELKQRQRAGYVPPAPFVHAYVGLDDRDRAFAALERAYDERSNIVQFLRTHPLYDPLRNDPRFAELLRRVGLQ